MTLPIEVASFTKVCECIISCVCVDQELYKLFLKMWKPMKTLHEEPITTLN